MAEKDGASGYRSGKSVVTSAQRVSEIARKTMATAKLYKDMLIREYRVVGIPDMSGLVDSCGFPMNVVYAFHRAEMPKSGCHYKISEKQAKLKQMKFM